MDSLLETFGKRFFSPNFHAYPVGPEDRAGVRRKYWHAVEFLRYRQPISEVAYKLRNHYVQLFPSKAG